MQQRKKRQAAQGTDACAALKARLASGGIDDVAMGELEKIKGSFESGDARGALNVVQGLTRSHWVSEKSWLKGMKYLAQVAAKKL